MSVKEISVAEAESISGGAPVAPFIAGAIVGGLIYDGAKEAARWFGRNFLARDGSGGSRYPIDQLSLR